MNAVRNGCIFLYDNMPLEPSNKTDNDEKHICLDPCFNGIRIVSATDATTLSGGGLNPYYNGIRIEQRRLGGF